MSRAALHGYVSGRVQGVGFRRYSVQQTQWLGIGGWVRNCEDGRVEFQLEGESQALAAMLERLRQGPTGAQVQALEQRSCAVQSLTDFRLLLD